MAKTRLPWWRDPSLTDAQKDARAESIARSLADAWLGLPRPSREIRADLSSEFHIFTPPSK